MKLTGWYRGDQKPVRVGVYQRKYKRGVEYYCFWNGKFFSQGHNSAIGCYDLEGRYFIQSHSQSLPWRGVSK